MLPFGAGSLDVDVYLLRLELQKPANQARALGVQGAVGMRRRRRRAAPARRPAIPRVRPTPWALTDGQLVTEYRLDRATITQLLDTIQRDIGSLIATSTAVPPLVKLVSVLQFLGTGSYQHTIAMMHGMAQSTFSAMLGQVLDALLNHVNKHIALPATQAQVHQLKGQFYAIAQVPNVIAAVDYTHVALVPPQAHEAAYRNRKQYHSLNVQMTCGPDLTFSHCCARYPGSTHDSMVLRNSILPAYMERHRGQNTWLLGDSGYPQYTWLMTPVRHPHTAAERTYNLAHGRTQICVERAFGLLKARFQCLDRTGGATMYAPEKVGKIVLTCAMLHNICCRRNVPLPPDVHVQPPEDGSEGDEVPEGVEHAQRIGLREERLARQGLIDGFF
ncbi:putative nuclease HARBI1 [Ambystoma mexicanum]|uniref:putative nuclease HARBI1 n=1 Tax=Ambystoma mexicanum TaxID=8296 RepID=UPI0037E74FB0